MNEHVSAGVRFFSYGLFEPYLNVTNAVTTRVGGRSAPPRDSLNLGLHVGDDPDAVLENRAVIAQILGFEPEALTVAEQVHGSSVAVIRGEDRGRGAVVETDAVRGADAMITNEPDIPLAILVADCVAVSLFDTRRSAIGIVHAGWKGTLDRIVEKAVAAMGRAYATKPEDLIAGLSPAVGPCHYPVGGEVAERFRAAFGADAGRIFGPDSGGRPALDLGEANRLELLRAGVRPERIDASGICTACSPDLFYSYRGEGHPTGRFAGIIRLHYTTRRAY
jgi:YfiH family protein